MAIIGLVKFEIHKFNSYFFLNVKRWIICLFDQVENKIKIMLVVVIFPVNSLYFANVDYKTVN